MRHVRALFGGLLFVLGMAMLAGDRGARADLVVDLPAVINESQTSYVTFRFKDAKRCVGGTYAGSLCAQTSDCGGGATGCTAAAVTPLSVTYRVDTFDYKDSTALLAAVTVNPSSDTVTVTIPASANKIVKSSQNKLEPHILTVTWTYTGGQGSDQRTFNVRDLPYVTS